MPGALARPFTSGSAAPMRGRAHENDSSGRNIIVLPAPWANAVTAEGSNTWLGEYQECSLSLLAVATGRRIRLGVTRGFVTKRLTRLDRRRIVCVDLVLKASSRGRSR